METELYSENQITSLDILAIFSFILTLIGTAYVKFFDWTTAEMIVTCVCAGLTLILCPIALRQKIKPFYILNSEGFFQKGIFRKYEAGARVKGGRFFYWEDIVSVFTEYRAGYENIPWLMIILETGENIYFPTAGFYDDEDDEGSYISSNQFIEIFHNYFKEFAKSP